MIEFNEKCDVFQSTHNATIWNSTGSDVTMPEEMNYAYFACSLAVWFAMPLLYFPFSFKSMQHNISCFNEDCLHNKCCFLHIFARPICRASSIILTLPLCYAWSVFIVYLYVPTLDVLLGFKNVFFHGDYKDDINNNEGKGEFDRQQSRQKAACWNATLHDKIPAWKLFEQFGEALPQFLIAVTFYSKNAHWLEADDIAFGALTMVLSAGSMVIGLVQGIMVVKKKGFGVFKYDNH